MSRLFLVALLAGIGGLAAALAALATDSASHLLSRLTQGCFSLLRAVALQADRLLRWLLSLLPEQHMNSVLLEEAEAQAPGGAANWGTLDSQLLFYLMLGALVCLALFLLIWVLRKGGLHGAAFRSRTAAPIQRRRPGFKELLRQLRHRFCRWAAFRMSYWKLRNTAPGLFVWLEQQMRARHLERSPGETARAFLMRIQSVLPGCEGSLSRLADCLDQHYFGDGQSLSAAEITAMRKQIRTKLQQQTSEKNADT